MTKKQLREIYKNKRRMIGPMEKAALDSSVADRFLNSEMYKNCSELLIYGGVSQWESCRNIPHY